jgi:hypothetical protein
MNISGRNLDNPLRAIDTTRGLSVSFHRKSVHQRIAHATEETRSGLPVSPEGHGVEGFFVLVPLKKRPYGVRRCGLGI